MMIESLDQINERKGEDRYFMKRALDFIEETLFIAEILRLLPRFLI